ncbi:MAG: hotdog fold thioesterase [Bacteroidetes bacterium]|nr:hotdog fold thioesterase [Bacteroidota bacterium]
MIDTRVTLDELNKRSLGNMGQNMGIEFVEITPDYLVAKMPVDHRTTQPLGMLNGGASAALAETVGSMAAYLSVDRENFYTLGLEIKCNHISPAFFGSFVVGKAKPVHLGKRTHVWQIEITNQEEKLVCLSTLTMAVLEVDEEMRKKISSLMFKV